MQVTIDNRTWSKQQQHHDALSPVVLIQSSESNLFPAAVSICVLVLVGFMSIQMINLICHRIFSAILHNTVSRIALHIGVLSLKVETNLLQLKSYESDDDL